MGDEVLSENETIASRAAIHRSSIVFRLQTASTQAIIQTQTARSSPVLAESVASKWFQSTLCSIREKELAVAHMNRTPDKDQPAAQLMRAALAHQKALLEEQRSVWQKLHPSAVDHSMDDSVLEPAIGLESRSARTPSDNAAPTVLGHMCSLSKVLKQSSLRGTRLTRT